MFNKDSFLFYFRTFYYLVCKLVPLKNYLTLIITAFAIFIISCSDMGKSSFENKPMAVKKESKVVKPKKKKQKIKTTTAGKTKAETIPAKNEEEEEIEEKEKPTTSSENTTIQNILTKKIDNYAIQNDLS